MASQRHHAVPRFYLKRFASDDGFIWLHDIKEQTAVRVTPSNAIVEKFLYSPEAGDNPKDDTFEQFLAQHVESPAAPALERLANGESISSDDRQRIAVFLAFQEFRIPRMRDAVMNLVGEIGSRVLDLSVEHPDSMKRTFEEMGKPISDEDLEKLIEGWKTGGIQVEGTKSSWLSLAPAAAEIAAMLNKMPWAVLEAPKGIEFLTSDSPIVKVVTDPKVPRMLAGGWLSPSAESTFALDPARILVIRPDGPEGRFGIRKAWCKDVNARLVSQSRRFVVSRSRDHYVDKIASKWAKIRATSAQRDG